MNLRNVHQLGSELAEAAHALPAPRFPQHVLERLEDELGFDSAICVPLSGPRRALASLNKEPFLGQLKVYANRPAYFERGIQRGREAARRGGGAYLDTEVFTSTERRELPFFAEIVRPQGISSQLVGLVTFRGRALASMHLCRHGRTKRFGHAELQVMKRLMPVIGLAHATFENVLHPGPVVADALASLSPREREITRHVGAGLHNREIAALLGSSPNTVRNQLHALFAKLGIAGRTELAVWFQRGGRDPETR